MTTILNENNKPLKTRFLLWLMRLTMRWVTRDFIALGQKAQGRDCAMPYLMVGYSLEHHACNTQVVDMQRTMDALLGSLMPPKSDGPETQPIPTEKQ